MVPNYVHLAGDHLRGAEHYYNFSTLHGTTVKMTREVNTETSEKWRRGWGSNPRGANAPNRFRVGAVMTTSVPLQEAINNLEFG